jgi:hypothetical protein
MKSLITLLLICSVAFCAEPPKMAKEITGVEGSLIAVVAECPGNVKFRVMDGAGLVIVPQEKLVNKHELLVVGKAGRYRIASWTSDASGPSDMSESLVVITPVSGGDVEDETPLLKSLRAAYTPADQSAIKLLAEAYRQTATSLDNSNPLTNIAVLKTEISKRSTLGVTDAMIPAIRGICGAEIGKLLSTAPNDPVTDAQRTAIIKQFKLMAGYLDRVAK